MTDSTTEQPGLADDSSESGPTAGRFSTSSSVSRSDGAGDRAAHWLLLSGNRMLVAGGIVALVVGLFGIAYRFGLVAIGSNSLAGTMFASGVASGTLTLLTVALSINQLILSRVFDSPNTLRDKLEGTKTLRSTVVEHSSRRPAPNDPSTFLSLIGTALERHAAELDTALGDGGGLRADEVDAYVDGIREYGHAIDAHVDSGDDIIDVLDVILGTEYAENMTATDEFRVAHGDRLSPMANAELDAIEELLDAIAITRQFFKTLALQQDFGRLSRTIAYSGLAAFCATVFMSLLYLSNGVTIPVPVLPAVFAASLAVIVTPLAVFIAYILRAATVGRRSVSVGPFVPSNSE
ncbi:hypothetical protein VB773_22455 [Haloarculaceae archaeon H-GB2-1]|nr:hypothetical protein [Haloarculaceae archaeon H-GB1-1]MEA5389485.1 hypothetical protein [Haloarculaceae archaeon H-GB11]MEA5410062.1 hypothetical protein [Haloarculaceae archaeon H-GB2-1]